MAVFLRRSDDLRDIDSSILWYAVTGTRVDRAIDRRLPDLGAHLEEEFDQVRDQWWIIGKKLGQTKSARLAHMPTAASYNSDFGLMMAWIRLTERICKELNSCLSVGHFIFFLLELAVNHIPIKIKQLNVESTASPLP